MKLSIGDKTYAIYFRHEPDHYGEVIGDKGVSIWIFGRTYCGIVSIVNGERIPCSEGYAYCSQYDVYNKETGRKKALARALQHFTYQERSYFWQVYLNRRDLDKL